MRGASYITRASLHGGIFQAERQTKTSWGGANFEWGRGYTQAWRGIPWVVLKDSLRLFPHFKQHLSFCYHLWSTDFLETSRLFWEFLSLAKAALGFTKDEGTWEDTGKQLPASLNILAGSETPKPGKIKDLMTNVMLQVPALHLHQHFIWGFYFHLQLNCLEFISWKVWSVSRWDEAHCRGQCVSEEDVNFCPGGIVHFAWGTAKEGLLVWHTYLHHNYQREMEKVCVYVCVSTHIYMPSYYI